MTEHCCTCGSPVIVAGSGTTHWYVPVNAKPNLCTRIAALEKVIRALVVENEPESYGYEVYSCAYCGADKAYDGEFIDIRHASTCPYALARTAIGEPVKYEEEK